MRFAAAGALVASAVLVFSCTPPPAKMEALPPPIVPVKAPVEGHKTPRQKKGRETFRPLAIVRTETVDAGQGKLASADRSQTAHAHTMPVEASALSQPRSIPIPERSSGAFPAALEIRSHAERTTEPVRREILSAPSASSPFGHPSSALPLQHPQVVSAPPKAPAAASPAASPGYQRGQLGQSKTAVFPPKKGLERSNTFSLEVLFIAMVLAVLCGAGWYSIRARDRGNFRGGRF